MKHISPWSPDEFYSGGTASDTKSTVAGTPDGLVFYDRRGGSSFSYNLPLPQGTYTVQLFFFDPTYTKAGQRLFNVTAQGQSELKDFDIIANGGGTKPIGKPFSVKVVNGRITLFFTGVINLATVSGIEVLD